MGLDQFEFKITSFGKEKLELKRKNNPEAVFTQGMGMLHLLVNPQKKSPHNYIRHEYALVPHELTEEVNI